MYLVEIRITPPVISCDNTKQTPNLSLVHGNYNTSSLAFWYLMAVLLNLQSASYTLWQYEDNNINTDEAEVDVMT